MNEASTIDMYARDEFEFDDEYGDENQAYENGQRSPGRHFEYGGEGATGNYDEYDEDGDYVDYDKEETSDWCGKSRGSRQVYIVTG